MQDYTLYDLLKEVWPTYAKCGLLILGVAAGLAIRLNKILREDRRYNRELEGIAASEELYKENVPQELSPEELPDDEIIARARA